MNRRTCSFVASSVIITGLLLFAFCGLGFCRVERGLMMRLGGIRNIDPQQNGLVLLQMEPLARFAVQQHNNNNQQKSLVKFSRLVKAREQLVAGTMYYFTIEATDAAGNTNLYDAKLWVKPWANFKELQEFKLSDQQSL